MRSAAPYAVFPFVLHAGAGRALGGFGEVSGLDPVTRARRLPGQREGRAVTLRRGVVSADVLRGWIGEGRTRARRDVAIALRDERGVPVRTWRLRGSVPLKYTGPTLSAHGGDVAVEELVLSAEGIDLAG